MRSERCQNCAIQREDGSEGNQLACELELSKEGQLFGPTFHPMGYARIFDWPANRHEP